MRLVDPQARRRDEAKKVLRAVGNRNFVGATVYYHATVGERPPERQGRCALLHETIGLLVQYEERRKAASTVAEHSADFSQVDGHVGRKHMGEDRIQEHEGE